MHEKGLKLHPSSLWAVSNRATSNNNKPIFWLQDLFQHSSCHLHQDNDSLRCFFTAFKVIIFIHKSKFIHWRRNKLQKWFLRSTFICFEWVLRVRKYSNTFQNTQRWLNNPNSWMLNVFCDLKSLWSLIFQHEMASETVSPWYRHLLVNYRQLTNSWCVTGGQFWWAVHNLILRHNLQHFHTVSYSQGLTSETFKPHKGSNLCSNKIMSP